MVQTRSRRSRVPSRDGQSPTPSPQRGRSASRGRRASTRTPTASNGSTRSVSATPRASKVSQVTKAKRSSAAVSTSTFEWFLWTLLCVENWILDFGRPIAMLWVPVDWSPLNRPSLGDYFHMMYNVITPFCLLALLEKAPGKGTSTRLTYIMMITFVMGASIHLVGDSVNQRLIHLDYKNHIPLEENELMKNLQPPQLLWTFQLLYYYDEYLGHTMWYIPYFIVFFLYVWGTYVPDSSPRHVTALPTLASWVLMPTSALYYWYLVTEGQIFPLFCLTTGAMIVLHIYQRQNGKTWDSNGRFLAHTFILTMLLVVGWVIYLWNDVALRKRYPGLLYVPEPWSYYTLYHHYGAPSATPGSSAINATRVA